MEAKFCRFDAKKVFFFAGFRIWSETKMKLSKNKAKKRLFRFTLKRNERIGSETNKFWKRNKAKIRSINFALVGSEKLEAKWSEKKRKKNLFFHVSVRNACETDLVSLRFALKRKFFFCETGAPYSGQRYRKDRNTSGQIYRKDIDIPWTEILQYRDTPRIEILQYRDTPRTEIPPG